MDWRCPHCGAFTTDTDFCGACGGKLGDGAAQPNAPSSADDDAPLELDEPSPRTPSHPAMAAAPASAPPMPPSPSPAMPVEMDYRHLADDRSIFEEGEAVRQRARRNTAIAVLVIGFVVAGGYAFVATRAAAVHIPHRWGEDPYLEPAVILTLTAPETSVGDVELVCMTMAGRVETIRYQLLGTPEADRRKKAADLLGKWESLDDARGIIGSKHMPDKAAELMKGCRDATRKVGEYLLSFEGEKPPVATDGAPLADVSANLRALFPIDLHRQNSGE